MLKCKHPSIHATRLIKYDMFSSRYCSIDKAIMYQINDVIDVVHKILKMSSVSFFGSKVCIKSPCTVNTALLALIEVHGLLIQTLSGIVVKNLLLQLESLKRRAS